MRFTAALFVTGASLLPAAAQTEPGGPILVNIGALTLRPSGYIDSIGMSRSATTPDSVATKFGKIPLGDSPGESLVSVRPSRLMLKGDLPAGPVNFSAYLESDFMNFTAGQNPYRWRQYWGQAQAGKWELLGGQAWSLLRPNRVGTASDRDTMNTDVVDQGYHVGLLGFRVRQIRLTRTIGVYKTAVAWEAGGNAVAKIVRDSHRQHYELGGFGGRGGRRGVTASASVSLTPRWRVVTQQYWSKRAADQALGIAPVGASGVSTLEGLEAQVKRNLEIYSYAGLVYASRAESPGNRLVRQWTVGFNHKAGVPSLRSGLLISLQYSRLDREVWDGQQGSMDFLMCRLRYSFN